MLMILNWFRGILLKISVFFNFNFPNRTHCSLFTRYSGTLQAAIPISKHQQWLAACRPACEHGHWASLHTHYSPVHATCLPFHRDILHLVVQNRFQHIEHLQPSETTSDDKFSILIWIQILRSILFIEIIQQYSYNFNLIHTVSSIILDTWNCELTEYVIVDIDRPNQVASVTTFHRDPSKITRIERHAGQLSKNQLHLRPLFHPLQEPRNLMWFSLGTHDFGVPYQTCQTYSVSIQFLSDLFKVIHHLPFHHFQVLQEDRGIVPAYDLGKSSSPIPWCLDFHVIFFL